MKTEKRELKDLNLLDRFLFAEAVEDQEIMEIILEIILGKEIILKHLPQAEKEKRGFYWGKHVKLDVWAKDVDDNVYDTEVQKRDTKDLPKRSRLYNSIIDSKLLKSGSKSYNELSDIYIIIITPFDLFGKGLYKYTFEMVCEEIPDIKLSDGAIRIFLNTQGFDSTGVSHELVELLKYFENTTKDTVSDTSSEKIRKLQEKIDEIKSSEEIGVKFMNLWEEKLLDKQDAYQEAKKDVALKMKENGFDYQVISDVTELPIDEVEEL